MQHVLLSRDTFLKVLIRKGCTVRREMMNENCAETQERRYRASEMKG